MDRLMMIDPARDRRSFAPADDPPPPATPPVTPPANDPPATPPVTPPATPPAAKWWEGDRFADPARQYLTAKGLTVDDPLEAMPKLVDIAANAEKRIGKGLETIIDRPAKGEAYADWVTKNREALGLPADEKGYDMARPEAWPKDAPWDEKGEAAAKAIAVKYGIPKEALQELVNLQAATQMDGYAQAAALGDQAKRQLMTELERDFGAQVPAVLQKARQGAQAVAEKAGIDTSALANLSDVLTDKIGDANTIRFMAAIGDMLGDDTALALGKGGALTTTPAEARAELARLRSPEGEYAKAYGKGDRAEMERLRPRMEQLTRIAAGG